MVDADVAIIGASLAGAAAAIELGRGGATVLLIDRAAFPRRKPCGEGLSASGARELDALGLRQTLRQLPRRCFGAYTIHRGSSSHVIPFATDAHPPGVAIERRVLDTAVLAAAERLPSVKLCLEQAVRDVELRSDCVRIRLSHDDLTARFAVAADGSSASVARRLGARSKRRSSERFGVGFALAGEERSPLTSVHLLVEQDFEACLTPLVNGRLNVTVFGTKGDSRQFARGRFLRPLIARIEDLCGFRGEPIENPAGARLDGARRPASCGNRLLLAGDSCEQLDPIGGMGMTLALRSGRLAARCLLSVLSGEKDVSRAFRDYERAREAAAVRLRGFTALTMLGLVHARRYPLLCLFSDARLAAPVSRAAHGDGSLSAGHMLLSAAGRLV